MFRWHKGSYQEIWSADTSKDSTAGEQKSEKFEPSIRLHDLDRDGVQEVIVSGIRYSFLLDKDTMRAVGAFKEQRVYKWQGRNFRLVRTYKHPMRRQSAVEG